jgi:peptide chain release factor 1
MEIKPQEETVYLEIRPGTGGEEAKIWAADLLRMYLRFAGRQGWKTTLIDNSTVKIVGSKVFEILRKESGVHRVQRVPQTERHGRIHTSTATVAVIPFIPQTQIQINPSELEWQFFRASSQGGQNVQKVSTAVRLIHKPTGIVVTAQRERSQEQNRQIALDLLRSKLFKLQEEERESQMKGYRAAIGKAERAEKIRTYNFPQNRVTDHRIGKTWQNLESVLDGELEKITASLQSA